MVTGKILAITGGTLISGSAANEIEELCIDSRQAKGLRKELFVALSGPHHDGHQYLDQVYQKGIRNLLVSKAVSPAAFPGATILQVADTLAALQKIGRYRRDLFHYPVIGITGSNGKTMVKEWLSEVLRQRFQVVKSPKSYNSQVGVPLSVWQMSAGDDVAVFEAGISRPGEMERLQQIIRPDIGLFTNIGVAHTEGFSSQQQKISEKARLFAGCDQIVCCRDHEPIFRYLEETFGDKVLSWSLKASQSDFFVERTTTGYRIHYRSATYDFEIRETNPNYLENILHVVVLALLCGLHAQEINSGLRQIKPVSMRLELKRGNNNTYILDDSYNNDLIGLSVALDYLRQQPQHQQKTVILSDILQSGKADRELYREVSDLLNQHSISRLIGIGSRISAHRQVFHVPAEFYPDTRTFIQQLPYFGDEMVLVKGARNFELEKVVALLEEKNHGTVLEVNFEALHHNLNEYRKRLGPGTRLMVMVKAFAYGVGITEIAHLLQYRKVDYLGVAYIDEGIQLRRQGIRLPIMIMNPEWNSFSLLEDFQLEPEIYSLSMLNRLLQELDTPPPIHLKIESGMNRLGFSAGEPGELSGELDELIRILKANPQLRVASIFTHFSCAEESQNDAYTKAQADIFEEAYRKIVHETGCQPLRHALNSAGIVRWPQYHFDMVRLGIGLYGFDSSDTLDSLRPISTLKTTVSQVKKVKKGSSVGYSRKGAVSKDSEIATLAIGYADGYSRAFGNGKAFVLINGKEARTIGNVCMDMTMVDVTGLSVKEGDEAIVFGARPSIQELAGWASTIPYEILTNVSQRVKRVFLSE